MVAAAGSRLGWHSILVALAAAGAVVIGTRFLFGIGSIANVNNAYPWGWWVGFGVLSFVAFGGTGFTMALLVDVLGLHRFSNFVRPGITMGLLFYLGYVVVLMVELGRPWAAPVIFMSWQPTSALFEVAWCATAYTAVLGLEFGKVAAGHYRLERVARAIGWVYLPAVVLGVTLSHLHQSSVGTLLTIVPLKVDPRWWSELLPATFLTTAYMAGLSLVSIEHVLATRYLRLKPRVDLLAGLAGMQIVLIVIFLVMRLADLVYRGATDGVLAFDGLSLLFWIELVVGFLVPLTLFAIPEVRRSLWSLFVANLLLAGGALMLRLNTAVFGMVVKHWETYYPSAGEILSTLGVLAGGVLVYGWIIRNLPIHSEEPLEAPEPVAPRPIGPAAEAAS
jgi:Ni/Fe-hydrogenase subunit HybB-like protein